MKQPTHKSDCAHVPPTEEELKNLDEYARQNGGVNSHLILTLIAEVRRLREERHLLLGLTAKLESHPEDYDGPCLCKLCQSYGD